MSITLGDNIGLFYSRQTGGRFLHLMITKNVSLAFDRSMNGISWDEWFPGELEYNRLYETTV